MPAPFSPLLCKAATSGRGISNLSFSILLTTATDGRGFTGKAIEIVVRLMVGNVA
jgi:hypothetical protein